MSTPAAVIPTRLVERARKHLMKHGRPLLFLPRRVFDSQLVAHPDDSGRYFVLLGPEAPVAQVYFEMAEANPERDLLADLAKCALIALDRMPRRFECDGRVVGMWEVIEGSVCVRGPIALACLSWILREQRTGFYLTLPAEWPG